MAKSPEEFRKLQQDAFASGAPDLVASKTADVIAARKAAAGLTWKKGDPVNNEKVNAARVDLSDILGPKRATEVMLGAQAKYLEQALKTREDKLAEANARGATQEEIKRIYDYNGLHMARYKEDRVRVIGTDPSRYSHGLDSRGKPVNFLPVTFAVDVTPEDLGKDVMAEINAKLGDQPIRFSDDGNGNPKFDPNNPGNYEHMTFKFTATVTNPPAATYIERAGAVDPRTHEERPQYPISEMGAGVSNTRAELVEWGSMDSEIMSRRISSRELARFLSPEDGKAIDSKDMPTLGDPAVQARRDEEITLGGKKTTVGYLLDTEIAGHAVAKKAGLAFGPFQGGSVGLSRFGLENVGNMALGQETRWRKGNDKAEPISPEVRERNLGQLHVDENGNPTSTTPRMGLMQRGQSVCKAYPKLSPEYRNDKKRAAQASIDARKARKQGNK